MQAMTPAEPMGRTAMNDGSTAATKREARRPLSLLVRLTLFAIFLPDEASFAFGGLRFTIVRFLFVILTPLVFGRFAMAFVGKGYIFVLSDLLFPLAAIWMFVAPGLAQGFDKSFVTSGSNVLEFVLPYMIARLYLTNFRDIQRAVNIICFVMAFAGVVAMLDEITGRYILRTTLGQLTGWLRPDYRYDYRGGLMRAAAMFEHPILLGAASAMTIMLATSIKSAAKYAIISLMFCGLILAISSGPIGSLFIALLLLIYRSMLPGLLARWRLLTGSVLGFFTIFIVFVDKPLNRLLNYLTFDVASAYYRIMVWDAALPLVINSPWVGIGLGEDWARENWMGSSVDAFWLRLAMQYGIPGVTLIFLCLLTSMLIPVDDKAKTGQLTDEESYLGTVLSIIICTTFCLGFTVHFWGIYSMLLCLCAGMRANIGTIARSRQRGLS